MNYAQNTYMSLSRLIAIILLSLVLSACGGSGNDASTSASTSTSTTTAPFVPTLSVSAEIKKLNFDWITMPDASYYRLYENLGGASGFLQVGGDLTSNSYSMDIAVHGFIWSNTYYVEGCLSDGTCTDYNEVDVSGLTREAIGYFKADNRTAAAESYAAIAMNDAGDLMVSLNKGTVFSYVKDSASIHGWRQGDAFALTDAAAIPTDISLSADGSRMAISTKRNSWDKLAETFVYQRNGETWSLEAAIQPPQYYEANMSLDISYKNIINTVRLSGDGATIAMGLYEEHGASSGIDSVPTSYSLDQGAVFVYADTGSSWVKQAYIKPSVAEDDNFGFSLDIDTNGDTLVVSAPYAYQVLGSGFVYLFERAASVWSESYKFSVNLADKDVYGKSVVISGDGKTVYIGKTNHDWNTSFSEDVYKYSAPNGTWVFNTWVQPLAAWSDFGASMALSRDTGMLVVGAPSDNDWDSGILYGTPGSVVGYYESGAAFVSGGGYQFRYLKPSNNYEVGGTRPASFAASQGMSFIRSGEPWIFAGASTIAVSANGDTVAILSPGEDGLSFGINGDQLDYSPAAVNVGAIYLY